MDRSNRSDAINMVANVQKLLTDHGVNVTRWVPVIADDMKRLGHLFRSVAGLIWQKHRLSRYDQRISRNAGRGFQMGNLRQSMGHGWYTLVNVGSYNLRI